MHNERPLDLRVQLSSHKKRPSWQHDRHCCGETLLLYMGMDKKHRQRDVGVLKFDTGFLLTFDRAISEHGQATLQLS